MHAPLARRASNIFTGTRGPNAWPFTLVGRGGGWEQKADSTLRYSQAVPDPSTNRALSRLTSEVRRDPVHSTRYGSQRMSTRDIHCLTLLSYSCWGYSPLFMPM